MGSVEAQMAGTPSVVWDDGGAKETVLDSETGFHVHSYDLDDFASKVSMILDDKALFTRMSKRAIEWADTFSWKNHLDILEGVLYEHRK